MIKKKQTHSAFFFLWYPFCNHDCKKKSFMLTHIVTSCNKKELLSPTTKLCCYCLSKWAVIHCGLLSFFLFILNFSLFGFPLLTPHLPPIFSIYLLSRYPTFPSLFAIFSIIPSNSCPCCVPPSLSIIYVLTSGSASSRWAGCKAAGQPGKL